MKHCPVCQHPDSNDLETVSVRDQHASYHLQPRELEGELNDVMQEIVTSYQMRRCQKCGLEYADPMTAPPSAWYDLAYRGMPLYPGVRWEYGAVLQKQKNLAEICDLGCGSGAFLNYCRSQGVPSWGLDHSQDAVAACQSKGLEATLLDATDGQESKDLRQTSCLTAFHVLEHLSEPAALFHLASQISLPSATFWVSIPSSHRATRYFGRPDNMDQPPHHLTRWNEDSLGEVGKSNGWRLVALHFEPLPWRTALWQISTLQKPTATRPQKGWTERLQRWASYPSSAFKRLGQHRSLSGFSMLAEYRPQ